MTSPLHRLRFALILFFIPTLACGQDLLKAHIDESFDNRVRISGGGALVGLIIGSASGQADPGAVRLPLGELPPHTPICLRAVTRDGYYHAHATLETAMGKSLLFGIDPEPGWHYLPQLISLDRQQLAITVRSGPNCDDDPAAPFVPVVYDTSNRGDLPTGPLTVALNAPRAFQVKASLLKDGASSPEVRCATPPEGTRVAGFNFLCVVPLAGIDRRKGEATLSLSISAPVGDNVRNFSLWLPSR